MNKGEDFVEVKLTPHGEALAAGGPLAIAGGRYSFAFRAGETQRVTRAYDWEVVLKNIARDGEPLFQLAAERRSPGQLNQLQRAATDAADQKKKE